jgi:hypothetical protein
MTLFEDDQFTPEQLQKLAEVALRISRSMHPDDEVKAKEFQVWFMNIAQLEETERFYDCVR